MTGRGLIKFGYGAPRCKVLAEVPLCFVFGNTHWIAWAGGRAALLGWVLYMREGTGANHRYLLPYFASRVLKLRLVYIFVP